MRFFLTIVSIILLSATVFITHAPAVSASPVVDKVFIFQNNEGYFHYSDYLNGINIIVTGVGLEEGLILDIKECDFISESSTVTNILAFHCGFNHGQESANINGTLKTEQGVIVREIEYSFDRGAKYLKENFEPKNISLHIQHREENKYFVEIGGSNLKETFIPDVECENFFLSNSSESSIGYFCEGNKNLYGVPGTVGLIRDGKNGKVLFQKYMIYSSTNHSREVNTVHVNKYQGFSEIVIRVHNMEDRYQNLEVTSPKCSKITPLANIYSKWKTKLSYLCENNGETVDPVSVKVEDNITGTVLWPVDISSLGVFIHNEDDTVVTGKYLRSFQVPVTPFSGGVNKNLGIDESNGLTKLSLHLHNKPKSYQFESNWCKNPQSSYDKFSGNLVFSHVLCNTSEPVKEKWTKIFQPSTGQLYYHFRESNTSNVNDDSLITSINLEPTLKGVQVSIVGERFIYGGIEVVAPWCKSQEINFSNRYYTDRMHIICEINPEHEVSIENLQVIDKEKNRLLWPIDISKGFFEDYDSGVEKSTESLPNSVPVSQDKAVADPEPQSQLAQNSGEQDYFSEQKEISEDLQVDILEESLVSNPVLEVYPPVVTEVLTSQNPKDPRQLTVSVSGNNLPKTMVIFVPFCDGMKQLEHSSSRAKYTCRFFLTTADGKLDSVVKTNTKSNGGHLIEGGEFTVDYLAPPTYVVDLLYPSEKEGHRLSKSQYEEGFIYFQLSDYHGIDNDRDSYSFTYKLGNKIENLGSNQLSSLKKVNWNSSGAAYGGDGVFAVKIPASMTSGAFELTSINADSDFLGRKKISIVSQSLSHAELQFSRDKYLGINAKLNAWSALGGGKSNGGDLTFNVNYQSQLPEKKELQSELSTGWQAEAVVGLEGKKINANVSANIAWVQKNQHKLFFKLFKDYAGPDLYKKYVDLKDDYVRALNILDQYNDCRDSLGHFIFGEECTMPEEFREVIKEFKSIVGTININLLKESNSKQNVISLFLILKNGFGLKGNKAFEDELSVLQSLKFFSPETINQYLADRQQEESTSIEAGAGVNAGVELGLVDAGASASVKGVWENAKVKNSDLGITHSERVTQGAGFDTNLNLRAPGASQLIQRVSSEAFSRVVAKVLTRIKRLLPKAGEDAACRVLKAIMTKKGVINSYSNDCKGLSQVMIAAGFKADLKVDEDTIREAFQEVLGLEVDDTTVRIISIIFHGVKIDILDAVLGDYPSKKAIIREFNYSGDTLKEIVFFVQYEKSGKQFQDEYRFRKSNEGSIPNTSDSYFLNQQLKSYLLDLKGSSEVDFQLSRHQLVSITESDLSLDIGWGVKMKYDEKTGHQVKIPYERFRFDISGNLIQESRVSSSVREKFIQQLKNLANKNQANNVHVETIMKNLYQIILVSGAGTDLRGLVEPLR